MSKTYVAVTQAEPVWLDLEATTDKTCALISEAAGNGAQLVAFPEYWLPGYPAWIWYVLGNKSKLLFSTYQCSFRSRPIDFDLSIRYIQNSMKLESPEMSRIRQCAAHNQIVVVLGFAENINESLYISQAIIGSDGRLLRARKKMKPTHMERTIFGDSFGDCLSSVAETVIGRVGALSCWEHIQPLLKYHTCSQREKIHVAAWPPLFEEGAHNSLYSMSSQGTMSLRALFIKEFRV
jgi:predicted amidohydrolase